MWAAAEGHAPVVRDLLAAGADVRMHLSSGFTPLLFAVREGRIDVVRELVNAGADVNERFRRMGLAPAAVATAAACPQRARLPCCWP